MKSLVDTTSEYNYERPTPYEQVRQQFEEAMIVDDWRPVRDLYNEIDAWINKNTGRRIDNLDAFKGWENTGQSPIPF